MQELIRILLIILPMYITNASALVFRGKKELDFGIKFIDRKPLFGKGKTIKGTLAGLGCGILIGTIVFVLGYGFENYLVFTAYSSLGAILGDLLGSFLKRRIGFKQGKDLFLVDQLDFVFGALVLSYGLIVISFWEIILISILTLLMHRLTNYLAFKLKIKGVPW